jgi:hypothetical protein
MPSLNLVLRLHLLTRGKAHGDRVLHGFYSPHRLHIFYFLAAEASAAFFASAVDVLVTCLIIPVLNGWCRTCGLLLSHLRRDRLLVLC